MVAAPASNLSGGLSPTEKKDDGIQPDQEVDITESAPIKIESPKDADTAYAFVVEHGIETVSPEESRQMCRKIDLRLLPLLFITYALNFLDKQAISYSANFNLREDNHLVDDQYSWVSGSIFYLAYLFAQPVMSRCLQYFPIGRFVAVMVIIWGIILMTTAASRSFAGLMTTRFLLGVVESCINPAFVVITSQWYTRQEQPARISYWFLGNAIGQIVGGLIGYGVGNIDYSGSVGNWIWYFIIFGGISFLFGIYLLFALPDNPMNARWLSDHNKAVAIARVLDNKTGIINHHWKWYQFREALLDPQTPFLFAISLLNTIPAGGISSFGSIVIKGFGYSAINTTLLNIPQGVIQAVSILGSGWFVSRFPNTRCWIMSLSQIPGFIGSILLYVLVSENKVGRLISYYLISTHSVSFTMVIAILSSNYAGFTKKSTASALIFMGWCAGQIIAPQLFLAREAPRYQSTFFAQFICFALLILLPLLLQAYLMFANRRRDRAYPLAEQTAGAATEGMLDMTDQEQKERFRYVY